MSSLLSPCQDGSGFNFRSLDRLRSFLKIRSPYRACLANAPYSKKNPPHCGRAVNPKKAAAVDGLLSQLLVAVIPSDRAGSLLETLSTHVVCGKMPGRCHQQNAAEVSGRWQEKLWAEYLCAQGLESALWDLPARRLAKETWELDLQEARRRVYGYDEEADDEAGEEADDEISDEECEWVGDEDVCSDDGNGFDDDDSFSGEQVGTPDTTIFIFGETQSQQFSFTPPESLCIGDEIPKNLTSPLAAEESLDGTPSRVEPAAATSDGPTPLDMGFATTDDDGDENPTASVVEELGGSEEAGELWEAQHRNSDKGENDEVEDILEIADQHTQGSLEGALDEAVSPAMEASDDQESFKFHPQTDSEDRLNQNNADNVAEGLIPLSPDTPGDVDVPQGLPLHDISAQFGSAPAPAPPVRGGFRPYHHQLTPREHLRRLMKNITETISPGELRSGFIYGFARPSMPGYLKIGLAKDSAGTPDPVGKRLAWWQERCGQPVEEVFRARIACAAGPRIERLVHLTLRQHRRVQDPPCRVCEKRKRDKAREGKKASGGMHNEWFELETPTAMRAVELWTLFAETSPYDRFGRLVDFWTEGVDAQRTRIKAGDTIEDWFATMRRLLDERNKGESGSSIPEPLPGVSLQGSCFYSSLLERWRGGQFLVSDTLKHAGILTHLAGITRMVTCSLARLASLADTPWIGGMLGILGIPYVHYPWFSRPVAPLDRKPVWLAGL
ncbi:hypothetical protein QBC42DRAFT_262911 [Cladorrhinum samala]|uniref:Bacteriophage T5 Orf172 DNA-binding domain-containing protein n=1 Tax=Cladorrhinum samala TaxID=585594 RepID=A0AAV9HXG9_9PEZI|nr:hypothetical protein QBC42DRAFT_262911 [Cladorrhinum samala]